MERITNDTKDVEFEMNNNMEATNKLLLEMVQNQKENNENLIKVLKITIICFTLLFITLVTGFFVYESQFETLQTVTTQEADTNGGNAIINGGDFNYGESESSNVE